MLTERTQEMAGQYVRKATPAELKEAEQGAYALWESLLDSEATPAWLANLR